MRIRTIVLLLLVAAVLGCKTRSREVVVYSSVDQPFAEPVLRAIGEKTGITVRGLYDTEETKSTGILNRLIAESGRPQADIFWSGDPVRPFLLIKRDLVEPYRSPSAEGIPADLKSADGKWTGLAARARVLLVNKERVPKEAMPRSIKDLVAERWRGQTAMASPLFGTTTMHVAALCSVWGEEATKAFLGEVKASGVRIASSNGEVKRLVVNKEVAFGLTDTDDANEAIKEGAPVEVVYPDQDGIGTLLMPTAVVLLRDAPHLDAARTVIDALLSAETEQKLAESAAQMPLRSGVKTPAGVVPIEKIKAMKVDYARVAEEMERIQPWLREWVGI